MELLHQFFPQSQENHSVRLMFQAILFHRFIFIPHRKREREREIKNLALPQVENTKNEFLIAWTIYIINERDKSIVVLFSPSAFLMSRFSLSLSFALSSIVNM